MAFNACMTSHFTRQPLIWLGTSLTHVGYADRLLKSSESPNIAWMVRLRLDAWNDRYFHDIKQSS